MSTFYATFSASQVQHHWPGRRVPNGGGYVEVEAVDRDEAEAKIHKVFGTKWAFFYTVFTNIHELDRNLLQRIP